MNKFIASEESKSAFLEAVTKNRRPTQTLPGFVEGLARKNDGESRHNVATTAVWKVNGHSRMRIRAQPKDSRRSLSTRREIMKN